jgi:hypothetical protein
MIGTLKGYAPPIASSVPRPTGKDEIAQLVVLEGSVLVSLVRVA